MTISTLTIPDQRTQEDSRKRLQDGLIIEEGTEKDN